MNYSDTHQGVELFASTDSGEVEMRASRHGGDRVNLAFDLGPSQDVKRAITEHFRGGRVNEAILDCVADNLTLRTQDDGRLELKFDDGCDKHTVLLDRSSVKRVATAIGVTNDELSAPRILGSDPLTPPNDKASAWNAAALDTAAKLGLGVTFRYAKDKNGAGIESRRITDELSVVTAGDKTLVTGIDPDRNDWRAFRLDRITGYVQVIEQ